MSTTPFRLTLRSNRLGDSQGMDRRAFLYSAGALMGGALAPRVAWAIGSDSISAAARALHARSIVVDGNIVPPIFDDLPIPPADLRLVRQSGLTGCKATIGGFDGSFEDTVSEIAYLLRIIADTPDYFLQIRDAGDFARAKRMNKLGIVFSFESATCLGDNLDRIDIFSDFGVRVMQLSYNLTSPFGAGVMAPPAATLTDLGRKAIERMNKLGVALDLSHANPATTAAAMQASTKPVIISHGGCSAVHANPRNKTDDQLRTLANKGGVFGIFDLFYLALGPRQPTIDDYMAHMTHALSVCGEDHVGFGSDTVFAGMKTDGPEADAWRKEAARRKATGVAAPEEDGRLPYTEGLNRPDRALVIADHLLRHGYPARVAEKVLGANFVRVLGDIW